MSWDGNNQFKQYMEDMDIMEKLCLSQHVNVHLCYQLRIPVAVLIAMPRSSDFGVLRVVGLCLLLLWIPWKLSMSQHTNTTCHLQTDASLMMLSRYPRPSDYTALGGNDLLSVSFYQYLPFSVCSR